MNPLEEFFAGLQKQVENSAHDHLLTEELTDFLRGEVKRPEYQHPFVQRVVVPLYVAQLILERTIVCEVQFNEAQRWARKCLRVDLRKKVIQWIEKQKEEWRAKQSNAS